MQYKFINDSDLNSQLKEHHLEDITDGNPQVVRSCERFALSLMHSKLNNRYIMEGLLDSPAKIWETAKSYATGDYAFHEFTDSEGFSLDEIFRAKAASINKAPDANKDEWELDDPREPLLIGVCVSITLYRLFQRLSTWKIPEDVKVEYDSAMTWLEDVKSMSENPDFPLQEKGMDSIRYGGEAPRQWFQ